MTRGTQLILGSVLAVVMAVVLVGIGLQIASDPNVKSNLGDEVFTVGRADRLAPRVKEAGPLLFPDLLRKGRDIYVGHSGTDEAKGWFAVEAKTKEGCALTWARGGFSCEGAAVDGTSLTKYPTKVLDGQVVVDLRK